MKLIAYIMVVGTLLSSGSAFGQVDHPRYTEAERDTVIEFIRTIDEARVRIDTLQATSALDEINYLDAEEVIRDATQLENLIDEGHYVDIQKIQEMIMILRNLGEAEIYEDATRNPYKDWDIEKDEEGRSITTKQGVIRNSQRIIEEKLEHLRSELNQVEFQMQSTEDRKIILNLQKKELKCWRKSSGHRIFLLTL